MQEGQPQYEFEVFKETNEARCNPRRYAEHLKEMRQYYHGSTFRMPGKVSIVTKEGLVALEEAIKFLEQQKPREPIRDLQTGLNKAALDHCEDLGPSGRVGHAGQDGSTPSDRAKRYGLWRGSVGENISFGAAVGRETVIQLIIDDGTLDRGHRHCLFDPAWTVCGVASAPHQEFRHVTVVVYAAAYENNEDAVASRVSRAALGGSPQRVPSRRSQSVLPPIRRSAPSKSPARSKPGTKSAGKTKEKAVVGNKVVLLCAGCGESLGGTIANALGKRWHPSCLLCSACGQPIGGPFFTKDNKVYCAKDYEAKFAPTCAVCSKTILGKAVLGGGGQYHPDCFACSSCGTKLQPKSSFSKGGGLLCKACCGKGHDDPISMLLPMLAQKALF